MQKPRPGAALLAAVAVLPACRAARPRASAAAACPAVVARARTAAARRLPGPDRAYFYDFEVSQPAALLAGGAHPPRDPAAVGAEPTSLVQYVVDTAGRVDLATLEVVPSFHPGRPPDPPPAPVLDAARAWRFRPAAVAGCPVPQLIQSRLAMAAQLPWRAPPPNVALQATGMRGGDSTPSVFIARNVHHAVQARA